MEILLVEHDMSDPLNRFQAAQRDLAQEIPVAEMQVQQVVTAW
jgi:hypothetical protein